MRNCVLDVYREADHRARTKRERYKDGPQILDSGGRPRRDYREVLHVWARNGNEPTCYALWSKSARPFWTNSAFASLIESLVHAAHGSVFDTITTTTIEAARVINPGDKLLSQFELIAEPLFSRLLANINESETLAATRDLLLPKLISGEIRVKDAEKELKCVA